MKHFLLVISCLAPLFLFRLNASAGQEKTLGLNTVVIDPGHGGKDPGCVSKDKKVYEKSLTLSISTSLAKKIREAYPDVKVILTREKDVFIPLTDRAKIANNAHADLFISVHINSVETGSANGFSSHILGQSSVKGRDLFQNNFNECARENSVVLLEDDYTTNYQGFDPSNPESSILFSLMQNAHLEQSLMFAGLASDKMAQGPFKNSRGVRQDPFLVLWKTTMPSVLVECGFISSASDLQILKSGQGIDAVAQKLFDAFSVFKIAYDRSLSNGNSPRPEEMTDVPEKQPAQKTPESTIWYGTQVLALKKQLEKTDPALKGLETKVIADGEIFRYIAGWAESPQEAESLRKNIKTKFPDSFPVRVSDNKVERYR